jgi:ribose-phosphate pyrophosphokinase
VSPSGKAAVFGTAMRRFESFHPNFNRQVAIIMQDTVLHPYLFTGTSHPILAKEVADCLNCQLGRVQFEQYPDGEISLQIQENVRGRDVFVFQSVAHDPNNYLMELLIMIDALKRASARLITAVIPYFGYCRQDRKDKPRTPITAKLVANLIVIAGATRVLTMDLHSGPVQGFFDIPVDNLYARPILAEAFNKLKSKEDEFIVVTPDMGSVKLARAYARHLNVGIAIIDKLRTSATKVDAETLIGDVKGKDVLLADDMCSTGGSLVSAAKACQEKGAKRIFAVVTHGLFVGDAIEKIEKSPIEALLMGNTVAVKDKVARSPKVHIVSIAPLLAQAIGCIISKESISSLYD